MFIPGSMLLSLTYSAAISAISSRNCSFISWNFSKVTPPRCSVRVSVGGVSTASGSGTSSGSSGNGARETIVTESELIVKEFKSADTKMI